MTHFWKIAWTDNQCTGSTLCTYRYKSVIDTSYWSLIIGIPFLNLGMLNILKGGSVHSILCAINIRFWRTINLFCHFIFQCENGPIKCQASTPWLPSWLVNYFCTHFYLFKFFHINQSQIYDQLQGVHLGTLTSCRLPHLVFYDHEISGNICLYYFSTTAMWYILITWTQISEFNVGLLFLW